MEETKSFWAIVELMGHQRMAGRVEETTIAGAGFLRIDIPDKDGGMQMTRIVSPSAIYAINPVDEKIAREIAGQIQSQPIHSYDVPLLAEKIREEIRFPEVPPPDRPRNVSPRDSADDDVDF